MSEQTVTERLKVSEDFVSELHTLALKVSEQLSVAEVLGGIRIVEMSLVKKVYDGFDQERTRALCESIFLSRTPEGNPQ